MHIPYPYFVVLDRSIEQKKTHQNIFIYFSAFLDYKCFNGRNKGKQRHFYFEGFFCKNVEIYIELETSFSEMS